MTIDRKGTQRGMQNSVCNGGIKMRMFFWELKTQAEKDFDKIMHQRGCPNCESKRIKACRFAFRTIAICPSCSSRYDLIPHKDPTKAKKIVPRNRKSKVVM